MFPPGEIEEIDEEGSEPTRIADVTSGQPVLSPHVTPPVAHGATSSSAPRMAHVSAPLSAATAGSIPGEGSVAQPLPRQRMSGSTGIALGLVAGILIVGGPALYRTFWTNPAPTAPAAQTTITPPAAVEKPKTTEVVPDPIEAEVPEESTTKRTNNGTKRPSATTKPSAPKDGLTDEQRKLLERMGGGTDHDIGTGKVDRDTGGRSSGPTLTASQLTGVVQNNKVQLQRCYESALRANGGRQDGAIKITVKVVVGESGLVKSVGTAGTGLGNMTECMKSSVKRWRFPQSGGESEFEFPLVFQPGA
jgi:hypothetical protein